MINIYVLVDPRNGDVFYVGRTKDADQRLTMHLSDARKPTIFGPSDKEKRILDILTSGYKVELKVVEVLEDDKEKSKLAEYKWFKFFTAQGEPLTNSGSLKMKLDLPEMRRSLLLMLDDYDELIETVHDLCRLVNGGNNVVAVRAKQIIKGLAKHSKCREILTTDTYWER